MGRSSNMNEGLEVSEQPVSLLTQRNIILAELGWPVTSKTFPSAFGREVRRLDQSINGLRRKRRHAKEVARNKKNRSRSECLSRKENRLLECAGRFGERRGLTFGKKRGRLWMDNVSLHVDWCAGQAGFELAEWRTNWWDESMATQGQLETTRQS